MSVHVYFEKNCPVENPIDHASRKVDLLNALCQRLNDQGYSGCFAATHGVSPDGRIGRDVDFLVSPFIFRAIAQSAKSFFRESGLSVCEKFNVFGRIVIVTDTSNDLFSLEVDFFTELDWVAFHVIRGSKNIETYQVHQIPCAKWESFAKRVFLQFLAGNISKFHTLGRKRELAVYDQERHSVQLAMEKLLGTNLATEFIQAIDSQSFEWLEKKRWRCQMQFLLRKLSGGMREIPSVWKKKFRYAIWIRSAPFATPNVCFHNVGPDFESTYFRSFQNLLNTRHIFVDIKLVNKDESEPPRRSMAAGRRFLTLYCFTRLPTHWNPLTDVMIDTQTIDPREAALLTVKSHRWMLEKLEKSFKREDSCPLPN